MKATLKNIVLAVAAFSLTVVLGSCEHKPLLLRQPLPTLVNIVFDWSELEPVDSVPEGMTMYFYNSLTGQNEKFDVACDDSTHQLRVSAGLSDLLFYNNDLSDIICEGQDYANTLSLVSLLPYLNLESVYGGQMNVNIEENPLEQDIQTLVIKPVCQVRHFNIHLAGANTIDNAQSWRASLSDLTNSRLLLNEQLPAKAMPVTALTALQGEDGTKHGTVRSFGVYTKDGYATENNLIVYVLKDKGNISYYRFDVTPQIEAQQGNHVFEINVDITGVEELEPDDPYYPDNGGGGTGDNSFGGGIIPDIDGFVTDSININM